MQPQQKLTIGYMNNINEKYTCSPAHQRILDEAVRILEQKGHVVKKVNVPGLWDIL